MVCMALDHICNFFRIKEVIFFLEDIIQSARKKQFLTLYLVFFTLAHKSYKLLKLVCFIMIYIK